MDVLSLLRPYFPFKESEGATNIQTVCPCERKHKSFYIYIGQPSGKKIPGMSFCHRCGKGWSLYSLLHELSAPAHILRSVKEAQEDTEKAARLNKLLRDAEPIESRINTLDEALLGLFDYTPTRLVTSGFPPEFLQEWDVGFDPRNSRITFAIRDHLGRLAAVSGRTVLDDELIRYKVYTSSDFDGGAPGYSPDRDGLVYGLHTVYTASVLGGEACPIVVTEGYKACLWARLAGVHTAVALSGTACTEDQLKLLTKTSDKVVLFLDNDLAGKQATKLLLPRLRRNGILGHVARYPRPHVPDSPDDLTAEEVLAAVETAYTELDWRINEGDLRGPLRR